MTLTQNLSPAPWSSAPGCLNLPPAPAFPTHGLAPPSPTQPPLRAALGLSHDVMTLRSPISCDIEDILNLKAGQPGSSVGAVGTLRFPGLQQTGWPRRLQWLSVFVCGRSTAGRRPGDLRPGPRCPGSHRGPGAGLTVSPENMVSRHAALLRRHCRPRLH